MRQCIKTVKKNVEITEEFPYFVTVQGKMCTRVRMTRLQKVTDLKTDEERTGKF